MRRSKYKHNIIYLFLILVSISTALSYIFDQVAIQLENKARDIDVLVFQKKTDLQDTMYINNSLLDIAKNISSTEKNKNTLDQALVKVVFLNAEN